VLPSYGSRRDLNATPEIYHDAAQISKNIAGRRRKGCAPSVENRILSFARRNSRRPKTLKLVCTIDSDIRASPGYCGRNRG